MKNDYEGVVIITKKKQQFPPIYQHSSEYAAEHNELELFFAARDLNAACAKAINETLSKHYHYDTCCFDAVSAAKEVVGKFGYDRTLYVLANTVQHFDYDGRISYANKKWAQTVPIFDNQDTQRFYLITGSIGITNLLIDQVQHDYLLSQPLKAAETKKEAAHILSQLQKAQEPNSPNGTHFMAQVSPDFLARAKTKDLDRLMELLPFQSLVLSTLKDCKGTFALISKEENRNQPLRLRKPSIKEQLTAESVPGTPPAKPKDREVR